MAIRRLLEADQEAFGANDSAAIRAAFESILHALGLTNYEHNPAVMMVAKLTIDTAKQGERDPTRLREKVLKLVSSYDCQAPH